MGIQAFSSSLHNSYDCVPSLVLTTVVFFPLPSGFPPFPSPTQPSVLLGEDPPPYSPLTSPESGSAPVISCRVCQSLISVEGKIHQHVVKCGVCNEATVGWFPEESVDPRVKPVGYFRLHYVSSKEQKIQFVDLNDGCRNKDICFTFCDHRPLSRWKKVNPSMNQTIST